jgi:hypothetical protein
MPAAKGDAVPEANSEEPPEVSLHAVRIKNFPTENKPNKNSMQKTNSPAAGGLPGLLADTPNKPPPAAPPMGVVVPPPAEGVPKEVEVLPIVKGVVGPGQKKNT